MGNAQCRGGEAEIIARTTRCRKCGNFHEGETGFACIFCGHVNRKNELQILETSDACEQGLSRLGPCLYSETQAVKGNKFPIELGNCHLCMDALGDCVLLSCGHGGVCEGCARSVVGNFKQCPVCRSEISRIHRVLSLSPDAAVTVELPVQKISACPPRVPSSFRKKKSVV